ncbi:orotidine-5'-phosphate decarboxylase [Candidatus Sumerlaeota bacterium]|nr:orotidine-5'-phosphate decarboxylase [Candidatus Sumerlaeota bacterium]MBI3736686.1 orotidine-5'-phosphate decarboxylase [Candidatus Sumerlaeota bacterium]
MSSELNPYFAKLEARCKKAESSLCIGLDPDPDLMPPKMGDDPEGIYKFCLEIVDATMEYAAAFKANLAFFESIGLEGWHLLSQIRDYVPADIPFIVDAKRSDIGNTAKHCAKSMFGILKADATTVNPLMGSDSIIPFLEYKDKGIYILCMTSNPGAEEFLLWFDLHLQIAKRVSEWNVHGNCGLVVGATKPIHLSHIKQEAPDLPMLVPGVGAQGGELELAVAEGRGLPRHRMLINVTRSIIYASQKPDFGRAARKAAQTYRDKINQYYSAKV